MCPCEVMDYALWSVSHHPVKIGDNKHSGSEDVFNLSRERAMRFNKKDSLKVCHHTAKFGGYRHCGWKYNALSFSLDFKRPRDQRVI